MTWGNVIYAGIVLAGTVYATESSKEQARKAGKKVEEKEQLRRGEEAKEKKQSAARLIKRRGVTAGKTPGRADIRTSSIGLPAGGIGGKELIGT